MGRSSKMLHALITKTRRRASLSVSEYRPTCSILIRLIVMCLIFNYKEFSHFVPPVVLLFFVIFQCKGVVQSRTRGPNLSRVSGPMWAQHAVITVTDDGGCFAHTISSCIAGPLIPFVAGGNLSSFLPFPSSLPPSWPLFSSPSLSCPSLRSAAEPQFKGSGSVTPGNC